LLGSGYELPPQGQSGIIYQVLEPDEVEKINYLIAALEESTLEGNCDPLAMMLSDIYPGIWDYGKQSFVYLNTHFVGLKRFITHTAQHALAILLMTT